MGISLGICGAGRFASAMAPLFAAHPLVDEVFVADLLRDRAEAFAGEVGASRVLASLEELCESDVDAVAIMTQRQLHGPQALLALEAGKHVYSAVPVGQTLDEVRAIVEAVERTGLVYMMGETSYYYPSAIYCRQRFQSGDFGEFVYGEGEYYHDMSHFYESFRRSGGADWKRVAGIPPMHYSTHSVAEVLSVTGARATSVSCMGFRDRHEDGVFGHGVNLWDNPFSNETAIMRTSDGGVMRINELRRIGWPRPVPGRSPSPLTSVQMSIYGTRACFEEQSDAQTWVTLDPEEVTDVTGLLECRDGPSEFHSGLSEVHPADRLPLELAKLPSGHRGSHQFLVDDFIKAVASNALPPVHVWEAASYCAPGLVAHQSALRDGELMEVPSFGGPPPAWERLDPYADFS